MAKADPQKADLKNHGRKDPPDATKWKKGQSGNPRGRPPESKEMAHLRHLSKHELIEIGNLIVKGSVDDLIYLVKDPLASALQTMIASIALRIIKKGDMHTLDILLNRLIGKVKDEIHHTGDNLAPAQVIVTLPSNGKEAPNVD